MANKRRLNTYGKDVFKTIVSKMTAAQRLRWLEEARTFALNTIPKSSLRTYLKNRASH